MTPIFFIVILLFLTRFLTNDRGDRVQITSMSSSIELPIKYKIVDTCFLFKNVWTLIVHKSVSLLFTYSFCLSTYAITSFSEPGMKYGQQAFAKSWQIP